MKNLWTHINEICERILEEENVVFYLQVPKILEAWESFN